ncbi:uncharacterized protein C19orf47 homolog isoform X2 [Teleopsis dalmanni]|uniref:uncharacterized protein C19orf47 homolog isoform X2 n=1 Tax=Teleopsis dalmanni TaxID=139649 RepID=UPI0018CE8C87|nr:uncharacterized protein C19orf47 homolog isoform X2 [Teleopsis dalmanni]
MQTSDDNNYSFTRMWVNFFNAAGVPSPAAASYAHIFVENRIQMDMLDDLNKEHLREMGILLMGDIIAILRHSKNVTEERARKKVMNTEDFDLVKPTLKISTKNDKPTVSSTVTCEKLISVGNGNSTRESNTSGTINSGVISKVSSERNIVMNEKSSTRRLVVADTKVYSDEITVGQGSVFDRISNKAKTPKPPENENVRITMSGPGAKPTSTSIFSRLGKKSTDEPSTVTKHLKPILKNSQKKSLSSIVKAKTITNPTSQNMYVVRTVPVKRDSDDDYNNEDAMDTDSVGSSEKIVKFAETAEVREIYSPRRKPKRGGVNNNTEIDLGYGSGIRSSIKSRLGMNGRLHSAKKSYNLKASTTRRLSPISSKTVRLKSDEILLNKDTSVLSRLGSKTSVDNHAMSSLSHRIGKVSLSSQTSPPQGQKSGDSSSSRQEPKPSVFDRLGFH